MHRPALARESQHRVAAVPHRAERAQVRDRLTRRGHDGGHVRRTCILLVCLFTNKQPTPGTAAHMQRTDCGTVCVAASTPRRAAFPFSASPRPWRFVRDMRCRPAMRPRPPCAGRAGGPNVSLSHQPRRREARRAAPAPAAWLCAALAACLAGCVAGSTVCTSNADCAGVTRCLSYGVCGAPGVMGDSCGGGEDCAGGVCGGLAATVRSGHCCWALAGADCSRCGARSQTRAPGTGA